MPRPGIDSLPELVAVAEQLVAAADGEQRGPVLDRRGDRVALGAQHVLGHQDLVAVLAAADVDQVVVGGIEAVARARPPRSGTGCPRHSQRRCRKSMLPRSA